MVTPEPGHGRLRASHADREHFVDVLKAAFAQGRLTRSRGQLPPGALAAGRAS